MTNEMWIATAISGCALLASVYGILRYRTALKRSMADQAESSSAVSGLSEDLDKVRAELAELKKSLPTNEKKGEGMMLNLNSRGRILRLHRQGESVSDIAKTLRLSSGEVALTIRVNELSRNQRYQA
jgi:DNA-binding NarL/FixJ family response regulator